MLFASNCLDIKFEGSIIASVVPELNSIFNDLFKKLTGKNPLNVSNNIKLGIKFNIDSPEKVGHDRIANAVGAFYKFNSSTIIVDCGTATTLDVITESGEFKGGIICPGMVITANALFEKTAQLYQVRLQKPKRLLGRNTKESIQSGIINGYSSMIEALIRKIKINYFKNNLDNPYIILTGGLAKKIFIEEHKYTLDENLTLNGLYQIFELNSNLNNI